MAEAAAVVRQKQTEKQPTIPASIPFAHLPDHTELPEEDGTFAPNFYTFPQSLLLTESLWPILQKLHPDAQFTIGQDSGIYWRPTEPPEKGAITPDWFYIPDVPPTLNGKPRRSYVLWQEHIAPFIVIEFVSATDGSEWDRTPNDGKFWIYEKAIHAPYYVIYDADKGLLDVYRMIEGRYQPVPPNERKHFPIPRLGIELGIWHGRWINMELPWLRVWDATGKLSKTQKIIRNRILCSHE